MKERAGTNAVGPIHCLCQNKYALNVASCRMQAQDMLS